MKKETTKTQVGVLLALAIGLLLASPTAAAPNGDRVEGPGTERDPPARSIWALGCGYTQMILFPHVDCFARAWFLDHMTAQVGFAFVPFQPASYFAYADAGVRVPSVQTHPFGFVAGARFGVLSPNLYGDRRPVSALVWAGVERVGRIVQVRLVVFGPGWFRDPYFVVNWGLFHGGALTVSIGLDWDD